MSETTHEQRDTVLGSVGLLRADDRGLIAVFGNDRLDWLHNLTTNAVRTLSVGQGNYAFAVNTQGRVLFDMNLLVLDDAVWLDIDRRWITDALAHLNKYIVIEDVRIEAISEQWTRFDVLGAKTADVVQSIGLGHNFDVLADVQHVAGKIESIPVRCVKDNLGAIARAVVYADRAGSDTVAGQLASAVGQVGGALIDPELFNVLRIEAGVPRSVDDIDHAVIAPETMQIERGISYVKGCYLGQEVIERMRSRQSMARKLALLRVDGSTCPPHNAPVEAGGKEIGRVTSACHSPALGGILAMGYVKTQLVQPAEKLSVRFDENTVAMGVLLDGPVIR